MNIRKTCVFALLIILLSCFLGYVFAQDGSDLLDMSLDDLLNMEVAIASTAADNIFNSVSTVSVIDREMIVQYNFSSVTEALRTVAGFDVMRTYLKRNIPTARGITQDHYANKVLVMINNVPAWNAVTGEASLDRVNINDVERIEVLKGPASVLYGTNAYSGAVNIILKNTENDALATHATVGDKDVISGGGRVNFMKKNTTIMISGNAATEKGQMIEFVGEKAKSGYMNEYAYGNNFNVVAVGQSHSVLLNVFDFHESYYGVAPYWGAGVGNDHPSQGVLFNYAFNHEFENKMRLNASVTYDWSQRNLSRTDDDSIRANVLGNRTLAQLGVWVPLGEKFTLEAGVNYHLRKGVEYENYYTFQDKSKEDNYMANRVTSDISGFGQLGLRVSKLNLLAGVRYTNNDIFGSNVSARGTAVYPINDKNSLKLIVGQSYRAPSLFELYFRTSSNTVFGSTYSSTDIEPETSTSIEMAYLTSFDKFFIQVLGYSATYQNKIFRDKQDVVIGDQVFENKSIYANGQEFDAFGVELEVKYKNPQIADLFMNLYYVKGGDGDLLSNYYNFKAIPEQALALGVYKNVKGFSASVVVNYQSKTVGPNNDATLEIDPQKSIDLNLGYTQKTASMKIQHNLSVKNITDDEWAIPEYVRRKSVGLNYVPLGFGRRFVYTIKVSK